MKLFLDENLSSVHAFFLREQGHDAISVVEAGLSGKPDEAIREFAIQTEKSASDLGLGFCQHGAISSKGYARRDSLEDLPSHRRSDSRTHPENYDFVAE